MNMLSVVINAYNEEKGLPRVIASVKDLADEIVVVDQESTDKTAEVAKKLGAKVFSHKKVDYVEPARNFAVSKATSNWILVLDVDEEVSSDLSKKIKTILKKPSADYFRIPRKNLVFGKWLKHSRWWPDYNIRLFKKGSVLWNEIIHAVPMTEGKGLDLDVKEENAVVHHHYETIEQYLERLNRYTSVQAKLKTKEGYVFSWKDLLVKPSGEFFSRYFFGEGYKDGLHGLSLSLLQAFSELILYLKIWQSNKFKEENLDLTEVLEVVNSQEKEARYWKAGSMYNQTGKFTDRIRRKLKI